MLIMLLSEVKEESVSVREDVELKSRSHPPKELGKLGIVISRHTKQPEAKLMHSRG